MWLDGSGAVIAEQDSATTLITAPVEGTYSVNWLVQNGNFCSDTATYPLTFYDQPNTNAGSDTILCGLEIDLYGTATAGIFLWQDAPGLTFANPLLVNTMLSAEEFGEYEVIANEINGVCTSSDTVNIEFLSQPQIQSPQFECTGADAQFVLTFDVAFGDTANYEISGLQGNLNDYIFTSDPLDSETPVEVSLTDFGICGADTFTGTYFCEVITNAGTMSTDTLRICGSEEIIDAAPASDLALDSNDTLLYALHDNAGAQLGNTFAWSETPQFTFQPEMDYEQVYFISSVATSVGDGGINYNDPLLSVSIGTPVIFYEIPVSAISGAFTVCPYNAANIPVVSGGAFPQYIEYNLNGDIFTDTIFSSGQELQIPDSGQVQLLTAQSEFCVGEASGEVSVSHFDLPGANMEGPAEICEGDTAMIELAFQGSPPFQFDIYKDGNIFESSQSPSNSFAFTALVDGQYSIENLNDQNCFQSNLDSLSLELIPLPQVSAGSDTVLCAGDSVLLGGQALANQVYTWQNDEYLITPNQAQTQFVAPDTTTALFLQLVLSAQKEGCSKTDTVQVSVSPLPNPQIEGPSALCSGDSIALGVNTTGSVSWQPEASFTNSTGLQTEYFGSQDTTVVLTAVSEYGCIDSVLYPIDVQLAPTGLFTVSETGGCAPLTVEFESMESGPDYTYNWNIDGQSIEIDGAVATATYPDTGFYEAALTVLLSNGCEGNYALPSPISVSVNNTDFYFTPSQPKRTDPRVVFINESPPDVDSEWQFGELGTATSRDAVFNFPDGVAAIYEVCLTTIDPGGCAVKKCEEVEIVPGLDIYVPNSFTPDNSDGVNDFFYPVIQPSQAYEYRFWVVNREGQIVFDTNEVEGKWDGTHPESDRLLESEQFVWYLNIRPEVGVDIEQKTGTVLLLR
jgi:PKD repeat protein